MQDPNDVSESEESYEETDEEDQFADADEDDVCIAAMVWDHQSYLSFQTVGTNISTSLTAATTTSKPIAKASLATVVTRNSDGTENKSIIDGDWPSLPAPSGLFQLFFAHVFHDRILLEIYRIWAIRV